LTIFPWLGGWFFLLFSIASFISVLFYPFMTYLSVVIRLFKTDPNKGKTPRDPLLAEKATPAELLKLAKAKLKERKPLTRGSCDKYC
jgi:hypothetical protein